MSVASFIASITEPQLVEVVNNWNAARASRPMPAWHDIDPVKFGPHLTIMWAWRWDDTAKTLIGRLAGGDIEQALQCSVRGRRIAEVFGDQVGSIIEERFLKVMRVPSLMHSVGRIYDLIGRIGTCERVAMPLGENDGNGVLGASIYRYGRISDLQHVKVDYLAENQDFYQLED